MNMSKKIRMDRQRVLWIKNSYDKCVEYERRLLEGEDVIKEANEYAVDLFYRIKDRHPELIGSYKIYTHFNDPIREVVLANVVAAKCVSCNLWYRNNAIYIKNYLLNNSNNYDGLDGA